jgi:hypothetical protein
VAIKYSRVSTKDPELQQVQVEVERGFSQVPEPEPDGIVRIDTASGTKTYTVKDTDKHVVCVTIAGPLTVGLPAPSTKRVIGVLANGANTATVQRQDGKVCSFGASKALANAAALFVADGVDWYLG